MRRHTLIGERILSAAPALTHVAALVRSSHERWDGGGYPDGLAGDGIPLGARIVAVCDAYDAMTSDRPYRPGTSHAEALEELRRCAGGQFDPRVVAALANLSSADSLTGLRTRRFVDDVLNLEFLRARRYRSPLTLAMADLDHFKQVNDKWGHPAGDAVLRHVATTLQDLLRRTDLIGRYGGEEFLLLHPQSTASGATALAERIREAVAALRVETPSGTIGVTLSIGIAEYDRQMESPEDLIAAADRALYAAKRAGRNRVVVASATPAGTRRT